MSSEFFRVKKGLNISPSDSSTVTSPEIGDIIVDSSDNNKLKRYDDVTSSWKDVGSGAGGINYISNNSDFEGGTVGYATYADAAGEAPVDGTGGTATFVSIGTDSVSPLRGTKSGLISKTANNAQGQGVSYDFIIDPADQAQVLRISFDYSTSANYADGDIRVYIYDYFNLRLIEVVDRDLLASSKGKFVGTFQTSPDSLSYRLIFHVASANALAYTVEIDNVIVGPQTIVKGAIVTDPEVTTVTSLFGAATTPPTFGTLIADKLSYSRRGKYLVIQGSIGQSTAGTAGSGLYHILLPENLSADATFIENGGNAGLGVVGSAQLANGLFYTGSVAIRTTNPGQLRFIFGSDLLAPNQISNSHLPPTTATWRLSFTAEVPIQGWSSNVVLSEDAGNREIYARLDLNNVSQTVSVAGNTLVLLSNASEDTTNSFDASTNVWVCPESGLYDLNGQVYVTGLTATDSNAIGLRINGTGLFATFNQPGNSILAQTLTCSVTYRLNKGDTVGLNFSSQTDASYTINGNSGRTFLSIAKRSSPQTIAASEVVACRYATNNSTVTIGTTDQVIVYEDFQYDTHNAYNTSTGIWTCPQSGYYQFNASITLENLALATGGTFYASIVADPLTAPSKGFEQFITGNGSSTVRQLNCNHALYVTKGRPVGIMARSSAAGGNISGAQRYNTLTIIKVG